jgi:hypothetical protein
MSGQNAGNSQAFNNARRSANYWLRKWAAMFDFYTLTTDQREQATKWFGGVALAIGLVVYGLNVLAAGHATIWTRYGILRRPTIELDGFDAQLYAAALIAGAAAAHFGWFWRTSERYWAIGEIGLTISSVVWAILAIWLLERQFVNFG